MPTNYVNIVDYPFCLFPTPDLAGGLGQWIVMRL